MLRKIALLHLFTIEENDYLSEGFEQVTVSTNEDQTVSNK